MGTKIRPVLASTNKWFVSKERYYELRHFCLCYPEWKKDISIMTRLPISTNLEPYRVCFTDPVEGLVIKREDLINRIEIIDRAAALADSSISKYILKAVTEGYTYEYLHSMLEIPCGREYYYERYRKFFWILDKLRK